MQLEQLKESLDFFGEISDFCESLVSEPDWKEVSTNILENQADFTVNHVRFIHTDFIDRVLVEELYDDLYRLGCFCAWVIADATDIDMDVIETMQKSEAYEAVGKLIVSMHKVQKLAKTYVQYDGYGHHFNSYDGNEENFGVKIGEANVLYHVFDNR